MVCSICVKPAEDYTVMEVLEDKKQNQKSTRQIKVVLSQGRKPIQVQASFTWAAISQGYRLQQYRHLLLTSQDVSDDE